MGQGIFEVQTIARDNGRENWVRVRAGSRDEAAQRVTALGEVVGEVRLVEVPEEPATSSAPQPPPTPGMTSDAAEARIRKLRADDGSAWVLSIIGIIFVPCAIAGWMWGNRIAHATNGQLGTGAQTLGFIFTILWMIGVLLVIMGAYMAGH